MKRPGDDVTLIAYGPQVHVALEAAETLAASEGIDAEVLDLRSLVPLDRTTILASVSKTRRAVVVHGASTFCGPGAEIASIITEALFADLAAPVARLGAANTPIPFAKALDPFPTTEAVADAVRRLMLGGHSTG